MKKENRYAEWLGFQTPPDIENAKTLGRVLGWILKGLIAISALFFLGFLVRMGMAILSSAAPNPPDEAIRNIGLALAAVVGLPFLVWRSIVAQQQVRVAEQGQITDRINNAVEGLGAVRVRKTHRAKESTGPDNALSGVGTATLPKGTQSVIETSTEELTEPNIEVRLGAIYSLERIANDSPRDHISVMEILCAYIRENTTYEEFKPSNEMPETQPRTDIQAAIEVLARRKDWQKAKEADQKFRLDLSFSNLTGIDFKQGDFSGALFSRCILERAKFDNCNLVGSRFEQALLNFASLMGSNLTGARWWQATFTRDGDYALGNATIKGLDLSGANVTSLDFLEVTEPFLERESHPDRKTFGNFETRLPFDLIMPETFEQAMKDAEIVRGTLLDQVPEDQLLDALVRLKNSPFEYWSPHSHLTFATGQLRQKFRQDLGLTGWPYDDD